MYIVMPDLPMLWEITLKADAKYVIAAYTLENAMNMINADYNNVLCREWDHGYKRSLSIELDKGTIVNTREVGVDVEVSKPKSRFYTVERSCPVCHALTEDCTCRSFDEHVGRTPVGVVPGRGGLQRTVRQQTGIGTQRYTLRNVLIDEANTTGDDPPPTWFQDVQNNHLEDPPDYDEDVLDEDEDEDGWEE